MPRPTRDEPLFVPDSRRYPAAERYVLQLSKVYVNGTVLLDSFIVTIEGDIPGFHNDVPIHLFNSEVVQRRLKGVAPRKGRGVIPADFEWVNPFRVEAELAYTLFSGGAYRQPERDPAEIKKLAAAVCADWFDDRYADVTGWVSRKAWCDFFLDIIWDFTCVVFDRGKHRVHVLCATDTD